MPWHRGKARRARDVRRHEPVDPFDVDERIAIRFADADDPPAFTVQRDGAHPTRLLLEAHGRVFSTCVHSYQDVDKAIDMLEKMAGHGRDM